MSRDEAERSLANTDWTGAMVDREPRQVSIVHSVRFPAELSKKLEAEADRQGVTPSVLIRDLVTAALLAADQDETVTVRLADLHRAIDLALHRAA
jgi:predicted DNA-binding protein